MVLLFLYSVLIVENAASDKNFCLADGALKLKTDHQYYYQVDFECYVYDVYAITLMMLCYIIGSSPAILYRIVLL